MKTVKRIFAVAVAVLLIAMMIPAASAATHAVNWTCNYAGYTYTVYKVADYNSTTGAFPAVDTSLQNAVDNAVTKDQMAALATSLDTTKLTTVTTFTTDAKSGSVNVNDGIYFIKCTQPGPNNKTILKDSIVVFPNKAGTTSETISLTDKVNEGQPTAEKSFLVDGAETKAAQTFGTTDKQIGGKDVKTITYVLKADIPGSVDNKLTSYVITDKMGAGLKSVTAANIESVVITGGKGTLAANEWSFTTDSADINRAKADTIDKQNETTGNTFGIKLAASVLAEDVIYGEGNKVVVTFSTELDYATAKTLIGQEIPNEDDMIYGNSSGYNVVPGNEVIAKTYNAFAKKVDAKTGQPIAGKSATFGLYEDQACTKLIKLADSDTTTGIADFEVTLPAGTYYIKETVPPTGYNLNSTVKTVTLGDSQPTATVVIEDTESKLPSTGGNGTLVFTIVGGSLVLLAAALFIVVMKKRSSAK